MVFSIGKFGYIVKSGDWFGYKRYCQCDKLNTKAAIICIKSVKNANNRLKSSISSTKP